MNQTIHMHQVLHAFAHRDDSRERRVQAAGSGPRQVDGRKGKRRHFVGARRFVITVVILVPLIVTEFVFAAVAPDGWIAEVLNQTAQLLALTQPF